MRPPRFSSGNYIEDATLTANVATVTDLDYLKNEWQSRLAKFEDMSEEVIEISFEYAEQKTATFFSIPGHNLPEGAQVKIELYETDISTTDLLEMDYQNVNDPLPVGIRRAGIDPYNAEDMDNINPGFTYWFDSPVTHQAGKLMIKHGYTVDPAPPSSGRYVQDGSGIVSIEAESASVVDVGSNIWTSTADGTASNSLKMVKSGPNFYFDPSAGPTLTFPITASESGLHDQWARCTASSGSNSIHALFDGHNVSKWITIAAGWLWIKFRTVTMVAGQNHDLVLAAKDYAFTVDKIVIQPAGDAAPTSTGPAESSLGTEAASGNISLRMFIIGDDIELEKGFSYGGKFTYMTAAQLKQTYSGFFVGIDDEKPVRVYTLPFDHITDSDKMKLIYYQHALGGRPFIVNPYNDHGGWKETAHCMLAKIANQIEYDNVGPDRHKATIVLVEV